MNQANYINGYLPKILAVFALFLLCCLIASYLGAAAAFLTLAPPIVPTFEDLKI